MTAPTTAPPTARHALLYDTAAALGLVDGELGEFTPAPTPAPALAPAPAPPAPGAPPAALPVSGLPASGLPVSGLAALPLVLERANAEIQGVLANLRDSRDALQTATVEKLQHTSAKLQEVTSATECAATDILDALERAGALVDALEAADQAGDAGAAQGTRDALRTEIFGMMGALQFQDITTQQLAYAASVLTEMESRLVQIARLFDPATVRGPAAAAGPDPRTFDPRATTRDAVQRQALADQLFT